MISRDDWRPTVRDCVAALAKRNAVRQFVSQFWKLRIGLYVVCVDALAPNSAGLTGVVVPAANSQRPCAVLRQVTRAVRSAAFPVEVPITDHVWSRLASLRAANGRTNMRALLPAQFRCGLFFGAFRTRPLGAHRVQPGRMFRRRVGDPKLILRALRARHAALGVGDTLAMFVRKRRASSVVAADKRKSVTLFDAEPRPRLTCHWSQSAATATAKHSQLYRFHAAAA